MSEDAIPTQSPPRSVARQIGRAIFWFFSILIIFLFLSLMVGTGAFDLPFILATGWMRFLVRTVPGISWNWDLVGMAVLCSVLIVALGHLFAFWITGSFASRRGLDWRWSWKWTICGFMGVGLFFLVGMCVGGVAHQVGWLSSQTESWYERKGETFLDMRQLDAALQNALLDANGDAEELRQALRNPKSGYFHQRPGEPPLPERFHVLLILDGMNKVVGTIIFPRDFARRAHSRGMYLFEEKNDYFQIEKLPELLEKHREQLLTL